MLLRVLFAPWILIYFTQIGKKRLLKMAFKALKLSFLNENKWHQSWPVSPITSKKIPTLIKIDFRLDNKDYSWVINPNIEYALQN